MKLRRIDSELVRRGLAKSRGAAAQMIEDGRVKLDGQVVLKPARQMDPAQAIVVEESDDPEYVSRGAHKLAGALDALGDKAPLIEGRRALDAGASTGGFTDVLLRRGAASVVAVGKNRGGRRLRSARVEAPKRPARGSPRPHERAYARSCHGRSRARSGGRRYVFHFADVSSTPACRCSCASRRFPSDGEASV